MPNHNPDTSGLNPQAARKGDLRQGTIQLTEAEWAFLDECVAKAKASDATYFKGRIGRADIVRGLLLALQLAEHKPPIKQLAIGEWDDSEGDCVLCGSAGYDLSTRNIDDPCPLCSGRGTHLLGSEGDLSGESQS